MSENTGTPADFTAEDALDFVSVILSTLNAAVDRKNMGYLFLMTAVMSGLTHSEETFDIVKDAAHKVERIIKDEIVKERQREETAKMLDPNTAPNTEILTTTGVIVPGSKTKH